MSIVLFMMFLFSGLMITLICRFTVFSEYEYTQGMYLGVHIPPEEKGSEIVRPFMEKEVKRQKIFQNINMLLSVLLCIPVFFWEAASVIIWTVWMCTYMIGYMYILNSAHRRLYKIKIQNGWINKNTQMIYVDTSLSADERSLKSNNRYHIITIASEFIMTIPFMINKSYSRSEGLIFALAAISISLICMILNIYVNKRNTTVYIIKHVQCRSISVIYNIVYDKQGSIFYVDDAVYNYSDTFDNISCGGVPDSDKKEKRTSVVRYETGLCR